MIMAFTTVAMSQAPEKFIYQTVIRDASGNLVCNGQVGVRVSILKNSTEGVPVYCETHQLTTNAKGLLTIEIGSGKAMGGVFSTIDWSNGPYFVKTETDVTGGSNYTLIGTQQLLSMPYTKFDENNRAGGDATGLTALANRVSQLEQYVLSPVVNTNKANIITMQSATITGEVLSHGASHVTVCGFCCSTSQQPTLADNHTADAANGLERFTATITGLAPNTTYYVCAYASNSHGTAYGNVISFTTPGALTDYDNNTYSTVQIDNQIWMAENLRTTHYANGARIALGNTFSSTTAYRYFPDNNASNVSTYGYLYNWKAVMGNASSSNAIPSGVQGICPIGWHVPSDAEWTQLTNYISSQTIYQCNNKSTNIAKVLASTMGWSNSTSTCAVGNNPGVNNATGFSVLPAGLYNYGIYFGFSYGADFWSATEGDDNDAYYRLLYYDYVDVYRYYNDQSYGFSVRCVRD